MSNLDDHRIIVNLWNGKIYEKTERFDRNHSTGTWREIIIPKNFRVDSISHFSSFTNIFVEEIVEKK